VSLDREELRAAVRQRTFFSKAGWKEPTKPLQFSAVNWLPDFTKSSGVMCILVGEGVPSYIRRRIETAAKEGHEITCVADLEVLSNKPNVKLLTQVDAMVSYVAHNGEPRSPKRLLKVLAEEEIAIDPALRTTLVRTAIDRCQSAITPQDKGSRLEDLIHFMFSQVTDFRVLKCNWKTRSEELDCVIQVRSASFERCWASLGAPHVIVEAKNRRKKTGQQTVSKLRTIMDGKRRTCRLGFLVSLSGFTSAAKDQVLRFASEKNIYVLLNRKDLIDWGKAENFDDALEALVTRAILD
jgi:hypothetical protein